MTTLSEELPKEMTRVRDEVLPSYIEIGNSGLFAATLMRNALNRATKALAEGDVVEMMRVYKVLKEFKT